MRRWLVLLVPVIILAGCGGSGDSPGGTPAAASSQATSSSASNPTTPATPPQSTPVPGVAAVDYSDAASWLCRPGKSGTPCDGPLDQTVLSADGSVNVVRADAAANPPIDCFYVYPTVSTDPGVNSDLVPDAAERNTTIAQATPFGQVCRVFVPVYGQLTLAALTSGRFGDSKAAATAYGDVVAAWEYYLAHDNGGRRVVLIGHSQGASVLKRLISEKIDGNDAVRAKLLSVILAGTSVSVPAGKDVGGDFQNIPACRTSKQTGCVVTWATFNAASPPPALSLFGRAAGGNEALCVNPAAVARGRSGTLKDWLSAGSFRFLASSEGASGAVAAFDPRTTYAVLDGLLDATCQNDGRFSYLEVAVNARGQQLGMALPKYLTGDIWGLHVLDMSLPMGNLVELVRAQAGE